MATSPLRLTISLFRDSTEVLPPLGNNHHDIVGGDLPDLGGRCDGPRQLHGAQRDAGKAHPERAWRNEAALRKSHDLAVARGGELQIARFIIMQVARWLGAAPPDARTRGRCQTGPPRTTDCNFLFGILHQAPPKRTLLPISHGYSSTSAAIAVV